MSFFSAAALKIQQQNAYRGNTHQITFRNDCRLFGGLIKILTIPIPNTDY